MFTYASISVPFVASNDLSARRGDGLARFFTMRLWSAKAGDASTNDPKHNNPLAVPLTPHGSAGSKKNHGSNTAV